jgi:hypothetical protein
MGGPAAKFTAANVVSPETLERFKGLQDAGQIASFLGTTPAALSYHLYRKPRAYTAFSIAKASGGTREILAPPATIKGFQRAILQCLTAIFVPIREVHGFANKRSVVTNARDHVRRRLILNFDLADFFPTINFGRVRGLFGAKPFSYPPKVASMLAHICCYEGRLPQGAPTSPIISNLICRGLDKQFRAMAKDHGVRYSRYADDITFSTNDAAFPVEIVKNPYTRPPELGTLVRQLIVDNGFSINEKKTRLQTRYQRQEVTGLVVNSRPNVPRAYVRNLRAALHDWKVNGEDAAQARFHTSYDKRRRQGPPPSLRVHLRGKLDFLRMVRGDDDPVFCGLAVSLSELSREGTVTIVGQGCITSRLVGSALWIISGRDAKGDECVTATAFSLAGYGIVTAAHTFDHSGVHKWIVVNGAHPSVEYPLTEVVTAGHFDLAQFPAPAYEVARFSPADARAVKAVDDVMLVGYPKWSGTGDKARIERGHVTKQKVASLVNHLLLSTKVIDGNSGGPVFDKNGRVVGVARYSSQSDIAPDGAVSVEHLGELGNASAQKRKI